MKISNKLTLITLLLIVIILDIIGVSFISIWREWFWNSISDKNIHNFLIYLSQFSGVVLVLVITGGYNQFLVSYISLIYRYKLTRHALRIVKKIEGYKQRIQEDCRDYPLYSITLLAGLGSSAIKVLVFIVIILYQSTTSVLVISLLYTIIGTLFAYKIAIPLINLNYNNQVLEAQFRENLNKTTYGRVHRNNFLLYVKLKYLQYFQAFFNQITIIIPLLILFPAYFQGTMSFGVLMQLVACINSIITESSYFINSFDSINKWLSCRKRLKEYGIIK